MPGGRFFGKYMNSDEHATMRKILTMKVTLREYRVRTSEICSCSRDKTKLVQGLNMHRELWLGYLGQSGPLSTVCQSSLYLFVPGVSETLRKNLSQSGPFDRPKSSLYLFGLGVSSPPQPNDHQNPKKPWMHTGALRASIRAALAVVRMHNTRDFHALHLIGYTTSR